MKSTKLYSVLRILIGWIFLWAGIDKVFGLGFATPSSQSWLNGVSPTAGFLENATYGMFSSIFQMMAGSIVVDILFVGGLILVGIALILGIAIRLAGYSGALMMLLIYLSMFPPKNNPLVDEHIVYITILLSLTRVDNNTFGLSKWWQNLSWVKKYPILK